MRELVATLALVSSSLAAAAGENPIQNALKKIGPAYMCGANYHYVDALTNLRAELRQAGLPDFMADAAMASVRKAAEANSDDRLKLTAEDCAAKYGRT